MFIHVHSHLSMKNGDSSGISLKVTQQGSALALDAGSTQPGPLQCLNFHPASGRATGDPLEVLHVAFTLPVSLAPFWISHQTPSLAPETLTSE